MKNVRKYPANKAVKTSGTAAMIHAAARPVVPLLAVDRIRGKRGIVFMRCVFCHKKAA